MMLTEHKINLPGFRIQGVIRFDFIGTDPELSIASSTPLMFIGLSLALVAASAVGHGRRIRS
jgi:hypothetical protein